VLGLFLEGKGDFMPTVVSREVDRQDPTCTYLILILDSEPNPEWCHHLLEASQQMSSGKLGHPLIEGNVVKVRLAGDQGPTIESYEYQFAKIEDWWMTQASGDQLPESKGWEVTPRPHTIKNPTFGNVLAFKTYALDALPLLKSKGSRG
jgi:hypothetical protein